MNFLGLKYQKTKETGLFMFQFSFSDKFYTPWYLFCQIEQKKVCFCKGWQHLLNLQIFRNKPFPVKAKIEYYHNILTVLIHNGMSNNDKDFEMCIRAENVILPKNGFFGVSAATGGLADDHDVLRFVTHSLRSPEMALVPDSVDSQV